MAAWTNTSARTALRNRLGVNSTQFSDAAADAALAEALDRISRHYPYVTSSTLSSQTAKRISVTSVSFRQILAVEVPVDDDPRNFRDWESEEEGVIRLPWYEPNTETVRIWHSGTWTAASLRDDLQQPCLTAAVAWGLVEQNVQQMIYWSQGGDSSFSETMRKIILDAQADWRIIETNLANRGSLIYNRFGSQRGRLY